MTKISSVSNLLLSATAGAVATLALQAVPANAANLTFSAPVDATSTTGLSLSGGGNFLSTDVLNFTVSGTPNFAPSTTPYVTNAAGVLTQPYNGGISLATGDSFTGPNSASIGALLIGNSDLGYFQLFPSNAANGSGSATPPTTFSFSNTLSSIFGTALDTTSTSALNLITNDSLYSDNSGAYIVSGSVDSATAVPEPFTIIGTLVGGTAAVRMRKKLKAVSK
jgi:hypothetical protein